MLLVDLGYFSFFCGIGSNLDFLESRFCVMAEDWLLGLCVPAVLPLIIKLFILILRIANPAK